MDKNIEKETFHLEFTIKKLKKRLEDRQKELNEVTLQLNQALSENEKLKRKLSKYEKPKDEYDYSWSWISKIVFTVAQANKPLRSAEIISVLRVREPDLNHKVIKEKFLSAFLNVAMKHERLIPPVTAKIRIIINDVQPRIASMEKYIADKSHGTNDSGKVNSSVQSEMDSLRKLTKNYTFDGKSLQLFTMPDNHLKNTVLKTTDNHYYYRLVFHALSLYVYT